MNKEWFIFKGTHHLGPYSVKELQDFFHSGELTAQSLVWKEGTEKWEAISKIKELSFIFGEALPPLPEDLPPPMPMPGKLPVNPISVPEGDEPPPIPLDAFLSTPGKEQRFEKKVEKKGPGSLIFGVLVALFIAVIGWFYLNEQSSSIQIRIKGMMPVYLEKLQETASSKSPAFMMTMALSLDGKTLYASANTDGDIISIVKLTSVPKRTLGTEDVEIMVRGVIKERLGEFARMQLLKGPQFVPGEYNIDFSGRKLHFINRHFKFLGQYSLFKKLNKTYKYQTSALIYAGTPREFENKMTQYREKIKDERLRPYLDKRERLDTFLSILNQTAEHYILTLDGLKNPKDISKFESLYIKEISPILQSLVLAANELSKKVEEKEGEVASYRTQVLLGKQMGELGADMITETRKLKKVTDQDKNALRSKFEARYKALKSQIEGHIAKLDSEIKKISD